MATATPALEGERVSVGRVFQRAMSAIALNPVVVLGLALLVGAVPGLMLTYVAVGIMPTDPQNMTPSSVLVPALLSVVFGLIVSALVQGALTRATVAANEGRKATFGESLGSALRVLLPLIALSIVFAIGIGFGFILLIIPGFILLTMWAVAIPSLVIERDGIGAAFKRSAELTKGARWKIFGLLLLLAVIYWLLSTVVGLVGLGMYGAQDAGKALPLANVAGSVIVGTIFNMLWGTIQPSLYMELRQWKDGHDVGSLEQVFA